MSLKSICFNKAFATPTLRNTIGGRTLSRRTCYIGQKRPIYLFVRNDCPRKTTYPLGIGWTLEAFSVGMTAHWVWKYFQVNLYCLEDYSTHEGSLAGESIRHLWCLPLRRRHDLNHDHSDFVVAVKELKKYIFWKIKKSRIINFNYISIEIFDNQNMI